MDIAGLVLSATSLALQLRELSKDVTNSLKRAGPADDDFLELSIEALHESEQSKLLAFVLFDNGIYGFENGIFASLDDDNQKILFAILQRLFRIWREIKDLAAARFSPTSASVLSHESIQQLERADQLDQQALGGTFDYEHVRNLVTAATAWNQKLERRITCYNILHTINDQTPARNIERLNAIAQNDQCKALGWDTLARLRQLVLGIENPDVDFQLLPIPPDILINQGSVSSLKPIRQDLLQGLHGREGVLIETLPYFHLSRSPEVQGNSLADRRVEELVGFLSITKDSKFRIPKARGYYHDPRHGRYCIIFDVRTLYPKPGAEITTLHSVLQASGRAQAGDSTFRRPSLDARFSLAYALAMAMSKFQSVGWLHQNIRSDNVVFAAPEPLHRFIDFSKPWLMGYGSSRSVSSSSVKIFDQNPIHNLYRHPDRWGSTPKGRFDKIHDMYSLGVVLLEISVWSPVEHLVKRELMAKGVSGNLVQDELLKLSQHSKVSELMGTQFSKIVRKCLEGKTSAFGIQETSSDGAAAQLELAFHDQVVDSLKKAVHSLA